MNHFDKLYERIKQHEQELSPFMDVTGHTISFDHNHWPVLITHATTTPSKIREAPEDLAPEIPRTGNGKVPLEVITRLHLPADELISLIELRGIARNQKPLHLHPTFKEILREVKKEQFAADKEITVKVFDNKDGTISVRHSYKIPDRAFTSQDSTLDEEIPSSPGDRNRLGFTRGRRSKRLLELVPNLKAIRVVPIEDGIAESQTTHQFNSREHPEEYNLLKAYLHRQNMIALYHELKRNNVGFEPNKLTKSGANWLFDENGKPLN